MENILPQIQSGRGTVRTAPQNDSYRVHNTLKQRVSNPAIAMRQTRHATSAKPESEISNQKSQDKISGYPRNILLSEKCSEEGIRFLKQAD
jgi:hypothetical protein